jgi:cell division protein ZapA
LKRGKALNNKTNIKVKIFGTDYNIKATESEEYIKDMASKVDEKMKRIASSNSVGPLAVSTLAALNFCEEFYREKLENEVLKEEIGNLHDEIEVLKHECRFLKDEIISIRGKENE